MERERLQRAARKTAGLTSMTRPKRRPRNGGVGDDQSVDMMVERSAHDPLMVAGLQVGRDLEEDGLVGAHLFDRGEERSKLAFVLQPAKTGRIGRADVDRQVARDGRQTPNAD